MGAICVRCRQCKKRNNEHQEFNIGKDIFLSKGLAYNSSFLQNINNNQDKLIKLQKYIKRFLKIKNSKVFLLEKL